MQENNNFYVFSVCIKSFARNLSLKSPIWHHFRLSTVGVIIAVSGCKTRLWRILWASARNTEQDKHGRCWTISVWTDVFYRRNGILGFNWGGRGRRRVSRDTARKKRLMQLWELCWNAHRSWMLLLSGTGRAQWQVWCFRCVDDLVSHVLHCIWSFLYLHNRLIVIFLILQKVSTA